MGTARVNNTNDGVPRANVVVLSAAVGISAIRAATLDGSEADSAKTFYKLTERYKPEHPPLRTSSGAAEVALAKHLAKIDAKCYTAWWCPHCQEQRENFGREAAAVAPFVQCAQLDQKQNALCKEKDIPSYPTWIIN